MKRTRTAALACLTSATLLTGCSAPYTPKAGEPVARLRVVTSHAPMYATDQRWSSSLRV